jgi:hypothetical protein
MKIRSKVAALAVTVAVAGGVIAFAPAASATTVVASIRQECGPNGLTKVTATSTPPDVDLVEHGPVVLATFWPNGGLYAPGAVVSYGAQFTFTDGITRASDPATVVVVAVDCSGPTTTLAPTTTTTLFSCPPGSVVAVGTTDRCQTINTTTTGITTPRTSVASTTTTANLCKTAVYCPEDTTTTTEVGTSESVQRTTVITLPRTGASRTSTIGVAALILVLLGMVLLCVRAHFPQRHPAYVED